MPDWLLCQSGDIGRCNRLLRLPLDDETRALIKADLHQAKERQLAQISLLLDVCKQKENVGACDRALRYNISDADRREILQIRKAVVYRGSHR